MAKSKINLEHYHRCCLIVANEFKRICDKYDLKYSLDYGSLIGAVRHKGFIPWDDDMDFSMPIDDYNKFIQVFANEQTGEFSLVNSDTDKDFPFSFSKLVLNGTHIKEEFCRENTKFDGVFIDIFPTEKCTKDAEECKKLQKKIWLYKRVLWMRKGYGSCIKDDGFAKKAKFFAGRAIASFFPYEKTLKKYKSVFAPYRDLDINNCAFVKIDEFNAKDSRITYDMTFANLEEFEFDGEKYKGFANYDEYLTLCYGDYMQLPPESERYNHGILDVDYGKYIDYINQTEACNE